MKTAAGIHPSFFSKGLLSRETEPALSASWAQGQPQSHPKAKSMALSWFAQMTRKECGWIDTVCLRAINSGLADSGRSNTRWEGCTRAPEGGKTETLQIRSKGVANLYNNRGKPYSRTGLGLQAETVSEKSMAYRARGLLVRNWCER